MGAELPKKASLFNNSPDLDGVLAALLRTYHQCSNTDPNSLRSRINVLEAMIRFLDRVCGREARWRLAVSKNSRLPPNEFVKDSVKRFYFAVVQRKWYLSELHNYLGGKRGMIEGIVAAMNQQCAAGRNVTLFALKSKHAFEALHPSHPTQGLDKWQNGFAAYVSNQATVKDSGFLLVKFLLLNETARGRSQIRVNSRRVTVLIHKRRSTN